MKYLFTSARLGFRTWTELDRQPYYNFCNDPKVMEFLPNMPDMARIDAAIKMFNKGQLDDGYTFWAVELLNTKEFIGFIGLRQVDDMPFSPAIEIGWRLVHKHWNNGYATEGAKACINYGFNTVGLDKIVSFTAILNTRSESIMKKIGMTKVCEFNHPKLAKDHWLNKHVLYEISNEN